MKHLKKHAVALMVALTCLAQGVYADNAATIAAYINTTSAGDLTTTISGNTVTVNGTVSGALSTGNYITLNIDAGVTVQWKASLTGNPSNSYALINISGGSGTFEVQSGGTIKNTNTGRSITNNSTATVTISGGTVESGSGVAIYNASTGTVNVSSGSVSAATGTAIYNYNSTN
ncbi:MAG: hypothetical protein LBH25_04730 [Fibromonadaceae bacterium]|jgi:hypothetical protein|nr:hypothetical protein [Fibromonadaceae bacterium]